MSKATNINKSEDNQETRILLFGLPGCGLKRLGLAWQQQFSEAVQQIESNKESRLSVLNKTYFTPQSKPENERFLLWSYCHNGVMTLPDNFDDITNCCVVDIRSDPAELQVLPEVESWLLEQLKVADAIVFNFAEQADLTRQSAWTTWLKNHGFNHLPVLRVLHNKWPDNAAQKLSQCMAGDDNKAVDANHPWAAQPIQRFEFDVGRVMYEHLLMGLDSSRHNLKMTILRVKAVLETFEYANQVDFQATAYRWDGFASEANEPAGKMIIHGINLDQSWLQQIIDASQV